MKRFTPAPFAFLFLALSCLMPLQAQRQVEALGRGVVAVRTSNTDTFISWRVLGNDPSDLAFNLYRSTNGATGILLNSAPITGATHFTDTTADLTQANAYFVRPVISGAEQTASASFTLAAASPVQQYLRVPLQRPENGATPLGEGYSYTPNDTSVGDLDGDGEYELVLKWEPTNARDSSNDGYSGNTYLDAYKLSGTRLWRIDLGVNIRAGAHDTPFIVYDFDGNGRAEVVLRTAPGTKDGAGNFVADPTKFSGPFPSEEFSHSTDYRNTAGRALTGPEFLTVFDGLTGVELTSTKFLPARHPDTDFPTGTQLFDVWGDSFGNRQGRFYPPGVAYLDGERPSIVMGRGYAGGQQGHPGRIALASWNWRDGALTQVWTFDSRGHPQQSSISGQGGHSASVADLNGDGRDDIVYGQLWLLHDGSLYRTGWGHGDAVHVSNMDPDRPGQHVFMPHESPNAYGPNALSFESGASKDLLFGVQATGDIGRGVAADVDPRYRGYEMWGSGSTGGLYTAQRSTENATLGSRGTQVASTKPNSINHVVWWDGDLLRELLDGTTISKWDWSAETTSAVLSTTGISSNNGTKSNPCLQADILGDWREEVIWRETTNDAIRIYTTTIPTTHRFYTLMHDTQYRVAIAWQNVGYNQPPHPSFFLGDGMSPARTPSIRVLTAPQFQTQPASRSATTGSSITLDASATANATYRWQRNGTDVANAASASLTLDALAPATTGLYTAVATNVAVSSTSQPAIVGITVPTSEKFAGSGTEVGSNIVHANGNTFDQILLQGQAVTFRADYNPTPSLNQIMRMSFLDLSNDIVQVEYSGPGSVSVVLDNPAGPAAPVNYNQSVEYMKGHAGIVVTGATESSHLSVFSVGRGNAVNQALFKEGVDYDGFADIAFVAISSTDGKFGGLRTANASYVGTQGYTGVYAPGVQFTGPVFVGDINASGTATPVFMIGSALGLTAINGGDLQQSNGRAVQVTGLAQLRFVDGITSHYVNATTPAEYFFAQTNKGRLEDNGTDVTAATVVNPTP